MSPCITKKFELTDKSIIIFSRQLFHIRYLRDIRHPNGELLVSAGDISGFLEYENNLSHEGACCVINRGAAMGDARVIKDAVIGQRARVMGNVIIGGQSIISDCEVLDGNGIYDDIVAPKWSFKLYGVPKVSNAQPQNG